MPHEKVYGFCENKCKVEVPSLTRFDEVRGGVENRLTTLEDDHTPINHAVDNDAYGKGTDSNYGHVKLSDSVSSTSSGDGVAATPKAVKSVADRVTTLEDTCVRTDTGILTEFKTSGHTLIYTFSYTGTSVTGVTGWSTIDCVEIDFINCLFKPSNIISMPIKCVYNNTQNAHNQYIKVYDENNVAVYSGTMSARTSGTHEGSFNVTGNKKYFVKLELSYSNNSFTVSIPNTTFYV